MSKFIEIKNWKNDSVAIYRKEEIVGVEMVNNMTIKYSNLPKVATYTIYFLFKNIEQPQKIKEFTMEGFSTGLTKEYAEQYILDSNDASKEQANSFFTTICNSLEK